MLGAKEPSSCQLRSGYERSCRGGRRSFFSTEGKEMLIKVVVQAIPIYIMSCFRLPSSLCAYLKSMCTRFWWGYGEGYQKLHWQGGRGCVLLRSWGGSWFSRVKNF